MGDDEGDILLVLGADISQTHLVLPGGASLLVRVLGLGLKG